MDSLMTNQASTGNNSQRGPQLRKLINKLENYDYSKTEHLSKIILELLENGTVPCQVYTLNNKN